MITFDALRADHLGVYGYRLDTRAHLDAFARGSRVFTDATSQSGTTIPSFASPWKSRFPCIDPVLEYEPSLRLGQSEVTLAVASNGASRRDPMRSWAARSN